MNKQFHDKEHAMATAYAIQAGPEHAEAIAEMMWQASQRGEGPYACYLHQSAIYFGQECICAQCNPGAAHGMCAGLVVG